MNRYLLKTFSAKEIFSVEKNSPAILFGFYTESVRVLLERQSRIEGSITKPDGTFISKHAWSIWTLSIDCN